MTATIINFYVILFQKVEVQTIWWLEHGRQKQLLRWSQLKQQLELLAYEEHISLCK